MNGMQHVAEFTEPLFHLSADLLLKIRSDLRKYGFVTEAERADEGINGRSIAASGDLGGGSDELVGNSPLGRYYHRKFMTFLPVSFNDIHNLPDGRCIGH